MEPFGFSYVGIFGLNLLCQPESDLFCFMCSFLKMVSTGRDAVATNFSKRFSFTNMTGSFKPRVKNGISSIQTTRGPTPTQDHGQNALNRRQNDGAYTIPYESQTGLTRYAPMAKRPGSTIPPGKPTPQHPTSSYSIVTTYLGSPTVETTKSAELTYSVTSIENTVCPIRSILPQAVC